MNTTSFMATGTTTDATVQAVIDAHTLLSMFNAPDAPRVLDVRTPAEFETAHIPGAYSVPLETLKEHREELNRHLDQEVILVCRSGARASQAGDTLAAAGLPSLRVLEGGMDAWERAGAPVTRGRQTWDLERQVRLTAGSLVLAAILGSMFAPKLKWLAAGVGGGLSVAAITNTCTMGSILSRMPWNRAAEACDLDTILSALRS